MGLWQALELDMDAHRCVSFVGGGGKTTLMYALAHEARARGKTVVVTTTTHILPHPGLFLTDGAEEGGLPPLLERYGVLTLGALNEDQRVRGVGSLARAKAAAGVLLVEGDGAKLHPLKAPADHEPVIPPESDAVVAVAGLDSLFRPIAEACHRPERVCALLGKNPGDRVGPVDVVKLLSDPAGGRKGVGEGVAFRCVLNKADTPGTENAGREIMDRLRALGIPAAVTCFDEEERDGKCWF